MKNWIPIRYREFYDVPRMIVVLHQGKYVLLHCPFDDDLDDYGDTYRVYSLPDITADDLDGDWTNFPTNAKHYLGEIAVADVEFDATSRNQMDMTILDSLLVPKR